MIKNLAQVVDERPNPFGSITPPEALEKLAPVERGGLGQLLNVFINVLIVGAGIYSVINIILAGYAFMGASGDPKKVGEARAKIYQTFIGFSIVAGTFVLAAIFGILIFGNWDALLKPKIPTIIPLE